MSEAKYNIDDVLGAVEQRYHRGWSGHLYFAYCMVVVGIPVYLAWATLEETPALFFILTLLLMPIISQPVYSFCRRAGVGRFQAFLISSFGLRSYRASRFIKAMFTPEASRSSPQK